MSDPTHTPPIPTLPEQGGSRGMALHTKILIGLAIGAGAGLLANSVLGGDDPELTWVIDNITQPIGSLFLRLLLMVVIPLVFSALVVGVAGVGDLKRLGRVGLKSFGYTLVLSGISVVIGITLANTIRPGERIAPETATLLQERFGAAAEERVGFTADTTATNRPVLQQVIETIVPQNPIAAVAAPVPNLLHLMFFALILGVAAAALGPERTGPLIRVLEALYEMSVRVIEWVLKLAPFAVAALLFSSTAGYGWDLLLSLGWFAGTVLLGLSLHMFGVYSASVALLSRISPIEFFKRIRLAMATAFSTSSSNATLPTALKVTEENLGVPPQINSFVLTVGATANQNGTALFEGVTILFLAQLAGVDLTLGQQVTIAYLAILGGIGTAGVPSGSLPFVVLVLTMFGIPAELIAIVFGIDRILDMCRTTLNVAGDITAATYVARSEGFPIKGGWG